MNRFSCIVSLAVVHSKLSITVIYIEHLRGNRRPFLVATHLWIRYCSLIIKYKVASQICMYCILYISHKICYHVYTVPARSPQSVCDFFIISRYKCL